MKIIQSFVHGFKLNCTNIRMESSLTDLLQCIKHLRLKVRFNSSQFFLKYPLASKRNSSPCMSHLSDGIVPHQALGDCLHHFKSKFGCFQYLVGQRRFFYLPKQLHLDSTYKLVTTFLVQFLCAP